QYARIVGDPSIPGGAIYFRSTTTIPDRTYDVAGLEPKLALSLAGGGMLHAIDAGARVLIERGHRQERAGELPTSDAGALVLDESHTSIAFAAYLHDRIRVRDYLSVMPGVRVEHVSYGRHVARKIVSGAPHDVAISGSSAVTAAIPGIGV